MFLSERNLAFRGSEEVLGSPHNGNFLGIFELLARRDPILKELQDRIKNKNTKDHYLSPTIQNELIELLATEVEKENLQQLKLAKYFSIILDCTPDMSHHEQMSVILRYVLCNEEAAVVKETFFGYLRISDSTGKGLLDAFLEKATELQLELSDCRGQSYDNGANMRALPFIFISSDRFFKNIGFDSAPALAAKEATFAYHTATHGQISEVLIVLPSWSQNCSSLNSR